MLTYKKYLILITLFLSLLPAHAVIYSSVLELDKEDIAAVRSKVLPSNPPYQADGSIRGRVLIYINDTHSFSQVLETIPQEWNVKGKLPQKTIEVLRSNKENYIEQIKGAITGNIKETEFIFTGYRESGEIALPLALLWREEYKKIAKENPAENQIKSILFSTKIKGDLEFTNFANESLGQSNTLNFLSYFNAPSPCGVSLYYLPDEQILDMLYQHTSKSTLLKGGGVISSYFLIQCFYKRPLWEFLPVPPEVSLPIVTLLIFKKMQECKYYPSESLVLKAFKYAEENYRTDDNASLSKVGTPPLLSSRRGIGSWLRWLIIGV